MFVQLMLPERKSPVVIEKSFGDSRKAKGEYMPIFMIERNFAEKLQVTPEGAAAINEINDEESTRWLISFLSVDKKKTFCLYEAPSAEAIREAAKRAGIPADVIVELGEEIVPSGAMNTLRIDRYAEPNLN
jgi:hypothetical protein